METETASALVVCSLLFGVAFGGFVGWNISAERAKENKHCVEYAQNTGECVRSMTTEELVSSVKATLGGEQ